MSYQVLARKWRPAIFKDLIGQATVVRILINSLQHNRLHPALIFTGSRGTGKTSTARILSKTLNCPNVKEFTPCNNCKTCQDINNSRSLDVMEIDGASNNGVEAIRQLKETITYLPSSNYKIYIIDEVHMLSVSAFNALLKTLEEPPAHVIFIMATTEMRKIPATVLSRCQILQFHKIADSLIYKQLHTICQQEKLTVEDSALWILVRESQGSLRDAQGLLDQMIAFCPTTFNSQDISDILGLTDRNLLMQSVQNLLTRDSKKMLSVLSQLQIKGVDPVLYLQHLIKELRNLLLLKLPTADSIKDLIPLSPAEKIKLIKLIQPIASEDIHFLLDMSLKGSWEINRIQDTKTYLEILLLRMSQAPYIESLLGNITTYKTTPIPTTQKTTQPPTIKIKEDIKISAQKNKKPTDYFNQIQNDLKIKANTSIQKTQNTNIENNSTVQNIQKILEADIVKSKDI